jgi:hypothetical protein
LYTVETDGQAKHQVDALPTEALAAYAELRVVLETAPSSGRPYHRGNPQDAVRARSFGTHGMVVYLAGHAPDSGTPLLGAPGMRRQRQDGAVAGEDVRRAGGRLFGPPYGIEALRPGHCRSGSMPPGRGTARTDWEGQVIAMSTLVIDRERYRAGRDDAVIRRVLGQACRAVHCGRMAGVFPLTPLECGD